MSFSNDLLTAARAYCAEAGISMARLSTLVANDGKFLGRLEAGGGLTVARYERVMRWLSENPAHERRRRREGWRKDISAQRRRPDIYPTTYPKGDAA